MNDGAWMSKSPGTMAGAHAYQLREGTATAGVAHYVRNGAPLCASLSLANGQPRFARFKCSWVAIRSFDRRCMHCDRLRPTTNL